MKVFSVLPIGRRSSVAFVHRTGGCALEPVELNVYPDSPEGKASRRQRVELGLTIRDVAKAFGVSAVEVSGVERGSHRPESWEAWVGGLLKIGERKDGAT